MAGTAKRFKVHTCDPEHLIHPNGLWPPANGLISINPGPDHIRLKPIIGLELPFFTLESIKPAGFGQVSESDPRQKSLLRTALESSRSENNQEAGGLECFSKAQKSNLGTPNNRRAFQNHSWLGLEHPPLFTSSQSRTRQFSLQCTSKSLKPSL